MVVADPRRRRLLLVGGAVIVLALTLLRGPVVLAAAAALVLAVAAYRLIGVARPSRSDWTWGTRADAAVEYEGRMGTLASLVDAEARHPDSPARLQHWFRHVASGRATRRRAYSEGVAPSSALDDYLAGPPRRLTVAEVDRLLTELDRP